MTQSVARSRGRALVCTGHGDQKFDLVLWAEKAGGAAFKKGSTVVFYDVWIRKNLSEQRPAGRMELSGSLSIFGFYMVDTLQEEFNRAFTVASPKKRLWISKLSLQMFSPGAAETPIRASLAAIMASSPGQEAADITGEGETADTGGEGVEEPQEASSGE